MPTYEYACKGCGEHLEVVQSFKDDPLTQCPSCGGELRKVFGNIGIAFKGSGFYRTDSRASGAKPAEPKAADAKSSDTKTSETKPTETKSSDGKGSAASPSSSGTGSSSSPSSTSSSSSTSAAAS